MADEEYLRLIKPSRGKHLQPDLQDDDSEVVVLRYETALIETRAKDNSCTGGGYQHLLIPLFLSFSLLAPSLLHHTNHTDKLNLTPMFYLGKPLFPLSVAGRIIYVIHSLFNSCPNIRVNSTFYIVNMDKR